MFWVILIIQVLVSLHFVIPFLLVIFHIVYVQTGKPSGKTVLQVNRHSHRFGIIVTAYKQILFIPPIVDSLLKQRYENFHVYIVTDRCEVDSADYSDPRITILKPTVHLDSNVHSIQYAIDHFSQDIEVMTIFDPDNLVHPDFFRVINQYFNKGLMVVQGAVLPKNTTGIYAQIDTAGMLFYSFIDRQVRAELGLSVNIWGCGVSILHSVYKKINYDSKSDMGGFDKQMQAEIALMVPLIGYAPDAILFDEKVSDSRNLENQRIRWINSFFKFYSEGLIIVLMGFRRLNFNLVYFGFNLLRPPYFITIALGFIFLFLDYRLSFPLFNYWIVCFFLFVTALITILVMDKKVKVLKGIICMPLFFFHQINALLRLKRNKNSSMQTEHYNVTYIDEVLDK